MDTSWDDVRLFLAVVEGGSISAAARRLRMTQPTVSRRLAELERRVAEPLFARGVAGTVLTPFGERLLRPAREMAESAGELARALDQRDARPEGTVRVTASPGVSYEFSVPFAAWLRTRLPDVRIELISTLQYLDLARREADLALRMQKPAQKDLVCLAELEPQLGAFASEAYAASLPRRFGFADVAWIGWAPPLDHLAPNPQLATLIPGFRPAFASDDFVMQLRAAEEGLGAVVLGRVEHPLQRRRLVELDLDLGPYRGGIYLVCARSALSIPRVRAVADLLVAELAKAQSPKAGRVSRGARAPRRGPTRAARP
jgi:DNA-binding transcriptional LysR family regulator